MTADKSLTPNKNRDIVKCGMTNGCPAFTASSRARLAKHRGQKTSPWNPRVPFNFNDPNQTMKRNRDELVLVTSVGVLWVCHRRTCTAVSHLARRSYSDKGPTTGGVSGTPQPQRLRRENRKTRDENVLAVLVQDRCTLPLTAYLPIPVDEKWQTH